MLAIEALGLVKSFEGRKAVDGVTFSVEAGEVFGLLGPNGAGKTTTIRILAGLYAPDAGSATVAGRPIRARHAGDGELRRRVGLLTEHPGFYDRLDALYNLVHFGRLYGLTRHEAEEKAKKLLARFALTAHAARPFAALSRGMKQKLAIARALLHSPEVVFLDEPTVGLDPEATREVRTTVAELAAEKRTIVLCTHHLDEVERLCGRAGFVATRMLAVHDVRGLLGGARRVSLELGADGRALVARLGAVPGVQALSAEGRTLHAEVVDDEGTSELVAAVVGAGGRVRAVTPSKNPLEEAYLELLRRAREEGLST